MSTFSHTAQVGCAAPFPRSVLRRLKHGRKSRKKKFFPCGAALRISRVGHPRASLSHAQCCAAQTEMQTIRQTNTKHGHTDIRTNRRTDEVTCRSRYYNFEIYENADFRTKLTEKYRKYKDNFYRGWHNDISIFNLDNKSNPATISLCRAASRCISN